MNTHKSCTNCQKPLAQGAIHGLCPECLLKAGIDTGSGTETPARFVAPSLDDLAQSFGGLELLEFVGQGGMGAVYRARQKALDRIVALKILPPGVGEDHGFADRFAREAKALARLNHPGIVTLYEFGQTDGLYYFLMEFVDGVNVRQLLDAGRIAPREALAIVPQICDALQYAHDQGIVHRDIKPENILLDRLGRVKVADFGLAKLVGPGENAIAADSGSVHEMDGLTDAGVRMGTPRYMAPEQWESPANVDRRTDIYALGVVLYQMLTGEFPDAPITPPSQRVRVDVRLDQVVLKALEESPDRRYQEVSEFKTAVDSITEPDTSDHKREPRVSWLTWAPLQSPRVREICAHMTAEEEREAGLRGLFFGLWIAATCIGPVIALQLMSRPAGPIVGAVVFIVGVSALQLMRRMQLDFLATTAWARKQGLRPGELDAAPGIILVGSRDGKAVVRWRTAALIFVLVLLFAEANAVLFTILLMDQPDLRVLGMAFVGAIIVVGTGIRLSLKTPVSKLTPLDRD
ncbi:MAG: hypothetical protein AMXMBFR84_20360 [Candidatus Hydrogenedentota bacterium]